MFFIDFSAEIDIFGGKNPFLETLRYASGSQKYFFKLYSTRSIRQKKPEVAKWKNKGTSLRAAMHSLYIYNL